MRKTVKAMDLSVVIPTHKRNKQVLQCISSCLNQINCEYELIVVSDVANPQLKDHIQKHISIHHSVHYLETKQAGVNRSKNFALALCSAPVVYFIDDDCSIANNDQFKNIIELHQAHPDTAAIGGSYLSSENCSVMDKLYNLYSNAWLSFYNHNPKKGNALVGGNASYKRSVFDKGFRFNESIQYGGAETDFHHQLLSEGYSFLLNSNLDIFHKPKVNLKTAAKKAWRQGSSKFFLSKKKYYIQKPNFRATLQLFKHCVIHPPLFCFTLIYFSIVQISCLQAKLRNP